MKNHLLKEENVIETHFDGRLKFVRYKLRKYEYIGWVLNHEDKDYGKSFRIPDEGLSEELEEKIKHLMMEHAIATYRELAGYEKVKFDEELDTTTETETSTS